MDFIVTLKTPMSAFGRYALGAVLDIEELISLYA
jgi:hypothetical protein